MAFDRFRDLPPSDQRAESLRREGGDPCPGDPGPIGGYAWDDQARMPHIFLSKLRRRPGGSPSISTSQHPAKDLSVAEVGALYAAAEFASNFDLLLDMQVTIHFGRLGISTAEDASKELARFTKNFAAWCHDRYDRLLPPFWMAVIEMDRQQTYHAHVLVHVPGGIYGPAETNDRVDFRKWVREYTTRNFGRHIPRAFRVSGGREASRLRHWLMATYLMKGFDRAAVLQSSRNAPHSREITLADIMPWRYCDPGPVALSSRVRICTALGPKRRERGAPPNGEHLLPTKPNVANLFVSREGLSFEEKEKLTRPIAVSQPFRSTLEDGVFDVRRLYPEVFYEHVTKLRKPSVACEGVPAICNLPEHADDYSEDLKFQC